MIDVYEKGLIGYRFIDLFAGIGGFRLALESFGAQCVYSSEWDKAAQQVYQKNFGELPDGDITKVDEFTIPQHDILCAGFPCQAFSISGKQLGFEDSRGTLVFDIARIVKAHKPKIIFLENVKNFEMHNNGKTLQIVKNTLLELGYDINYKVLNAVDFGVPQKRERIFFVCFRKDLGIKNFKFPTAFPLVRHLEDLLEKDSSVLPLNKAKYPVKYYGVAENYTDKTIRIGTVGKGRQGERIYSVKGIAPTLSAYGGGVLAKTGGYVINGEVRRLSPRECARLMGFPDSYIIANNSNDAYKQFGNSVVIDVLQYIIAEICKAI